MYKVIDSNRLQSNELYAYLSRSRKNFAVLTDFAAMEAYKGNTLVSIYKSMEVVSEFPEQVVVLKGTKVVNLQSGRPAGLQRRLIDERQTREFSQYVRNLRLAKAGDRGLERQLLNHGVTAQEHLDRMLVDARNSGQTFEALTREYAKEERAVIRAGSVSDYTPEMIRKFIQALLEIAAQIYDGVSASRRLPPVEYFPNTFPFRVALCGYLLAIRSGSLGGVRDAKPERIRNDMVDMTFAAYGTFFDGLLSADANLMHIHNEAHYLLAAVFGGKVPGHSRDDRSGR